MDPGMSSNNTLNFIQKINEFFITEEAEDFKKYGISTKMPVFGTLVILYNLKCNNIGEFPIDLDNSDFKMRESHYSLNKYLHNYILTIKQKYLSRVYQFAVLIHH